MKLLPVKSSTIKAVGHDPRSNTLRVAFNTGSTYDYANVPVRQYISFTNADSKGGWVAEHLVRRPQKHPYKKLEKQLGPQKARGTTILGNYQQPPLS